MPIGLRVAADSGDIDRVRELFREYRQTVGGDVCFDSFERELATLPGEYASPRGRLYLAMADETPAGCVGLRPVSRTECEMKRLYVRPAYRATGLGIVLAKRAIDDARHIGYGRILLDTLPEMTAAQRLYEKLGFRDTPPSTPTAAPGVRSMALDLGAATTAARSASA